MTLVPPSQIRNVTGITPDETQAIHHFLQGAMYCWCKNRLNEWFSLRDLMGGENFEWEGTPMFALYNKHAGTAADPVAQAGIDGGWLFKRVVDDDRRQFETREANQIREYRWIMPPAADGTPTAVA